MSQDRRDALTGVDLNLLRALHALLDERSVTTAAQRLGLSQPQVSKHLGVLRAVGLVEARADGRHRWYRVNGPALKPVHDWVRTFERAWNERPDRLDDLLAELTDQEQHR